MGENKTTFSFRVDNDTAEAVEEYVEERGINRTDALRRATEEYIGKREAYEPSDSSGGGVSSITIFGIVSMAIAPTLLATGYTVLGGFAAFVAATYLVLWATAYDVVLERRVGAIRDELGERGGLWSGFFRLMREDHPVDDPRSPIERAARFDTYAYALAVAGLLALLPLAALARLGYLEPFLSLIGTPGRIGILILIIGVAYGFAFLMGVSAIALLAIATSRSDADLAEDPAES